MDLIEKLENVTDAESFFVFVKALIEDWENNEADILRKKKLNIYDPVWDNSEWQNGSIGMYLEAASAWAKDVKQERIPERPTWKTFAEILYAGKIYE